MLDEAGKTPGQARGWVLKSALAQQERFTYFFLTPRGALVHVMLAPLSSEEKAYATTQSLKIWYSADGAALPDDAARAELSRFLAEVVSALQRNDTGKPTFTATGPSVGTEKSAAGGDLVRLLLVVAFTLILLSVPGLVLLVPALVGRVRTWSRPEQLVLLPAAAAGAVLRLFVAPHVLVKVGMAYPLMDSIITLDSLPRYGPAGPAFYNLIIRVFPADTDTLLWTNAVIGSATVLLLSVLAQEIFRTKWTGALSALFLALTPVFIRDSCSESLLVPGVFLLAGGLLLLCTHGWAAGAAWRGAGGTGASVTAPPARRLGSGNAAPEAKPLPPGARALPVYGAWPWAFAVPVLALAALMRPELMLVVPAAALFLLVPELGERANRVRMAIMAAALAAPLALEALYVLQRTGGEVALGNLDFGRLTPVKVVLDLWSMDLLTAAGRFPAGLTVLGLLGVALSFLHGRWRRVLPVFGLALGWLLIYYVDINEESMLRLHVPPAMLVACLAAWAVAQVAALPRSAFARGTVAAALAALVAASALPSAGFCCKCLAALSSGWQEPGWRGAGGTGASAAPPPPLGYARDRLPRKQGGSCHAAGWTQARACGVFFETNFQTEDRVFREAAARLPAEPVTFVRLGFEDYPFHALSQESLAALKETRLAYAPVHRYYPDYLLKPPHRGDRIMPISAITDVPLPDDRPAFFYLSTQCYAILDVQGEAHWDIAPDPYRRIHPACRWIMTRYAMEPVYLERVPNHSEFALPFRWYPDELSEMTIGLFRIGAPSERSGAKDTFVNAAAAYYDRVRPLLERNEMDEAEKILLEGDRLLADSPAMWRVMASFYFLAGARENDAGRLKQAIAYWDRIAEADIRFPMLLSEVGAVHMVYAGLVDRAELEREVQARLSRAPDDTVGLYLKAVLMFYGKQAYGDAEALLRKVLKVIDDDPRVYIYLALCRFYSGAQEEAEKLVARAIKAGKGTDPDAYYVRSIVVRHKDMAQAVRDIQTYLDLSSPEDRFRYEKKQQWLRKELENLRSGNPSPWWRSRTPEEPWNAK